MTDRTSEIELQKQYFRMKLAAEKQQVDAVRQIKKSGKTDFVLVDTRDTDSFKKEHIPGAIHIPVDGVEAYWQSLDPTKEYVTYCWHST